VSDHCLATKLGEPTYQDISDRRGKYNPHKSSRLVWSCTDGLTGGRTAWSTIALVNGTPYAARFWYDGSFMDQAKEDAAEMALRNLTGRLSQTTEPPPASYYRNLTTA
jgi:hypothetical protein